MRSSASVTFRPRWGQTSTAAAKSVNGSRSSRRCASRSASAKGLPRLNSPTIRRSSDASALASAVAAGSVLTAAAMVLVVVAGTVVATATVVAVVVGTGTVMGSVDGTTLVEVTFAAVRPALETVPEDRAAEVSLASKSHPPGRRQKNRGT